MTTGGIIAVGDSITAHCSPDLVFGGVPARSWAEWVALALGERLTTFASAGADSSQILNLLPDQLPEARLGLIFAGVNNTLSWRRFRTVDLDTTLERIAERVSASCDQVVIVQIPARLGMGAGLLPYGPRLSYRIGVNRASIARAAFRTGAIVVEAPSFRDNEIWLDKVHPTSTGHLALADAVLSEIGEEARASEIKGEPARTRPDMVQWRRNAALRFAVRQPVLGFVGWLVGR